MSTLFSDDDICSCTCCATTLVRLREALDADEPIPAPFCNCAEDNPEACWCLHCRVLRGVQDEVPC